MITYVSSESYKSPTKDITPLRVWDFRLTSTDDVANLPTPTTEALIVGEEGSFTAAAAPGSTAITFDRKLCLELTASGAWLPVWEDA